jgi:hypothetical protein
VAAAGTVAQQAGCQQQQQQQQQEQLYKQGANDVADVSQSDGRFQEWLLPCFVKYIPSSAADSSSSSIGSGGSATHTTLQLAGGTNTASSSSGGADYVLHVAVATCAIKPELQLVSPQLSKPTGKNYWVLDFGALPVGERTTRELVLQNTGGHEGMGSTSQTYQALYCTSLV